MDLPSDHDLPRPTRKRRRRSPPPSSASSSLSFRASLLLAACLAPCLLLGSTFLPSKAWWHAEAREIIATREWQRLGENDTVPAGLHIKMDMTTGEKWAKLPEDEARDEGIKAAVHDGENAGGEGEGGDKMEKVGMVEVDPASGALSVVDAPAEEKASNSHSNDNAGNANGDEAPPQRDYEMMHRVMSQLPPEELDRFGGLPDLPALPSSNDTVRTKLTDAQRQVFEAKMEEIWTTRQEMLAKAQENVADLPSMLKDRIATINDYLGDVKGSLQTIVEERGKDGGDADDDEDDGMMANDILSALKDLEFQLSDVDMARDFHTLGGWSPLVTLLDEDAHALEGIDDDEAMVAVVDEVRALAAMTIGTAVGNLGEFRPWALEPVAAGDDTATGAASALSLLVASFERELSHRSAQMGDHTMAVEQMSHDRYKARATYKLRAVYAIGALLRGNPAAQRHFVSNQGADLLARDALGTVSHVRGTIDDAMLMKLDYRFASKVLALGEDVVVDVVLHQEAYAPDDERTEPTDGAVAAGHLVAAFTSERWCDLALRMLVPPSDAIGGTAARGIKERALGAVRQLAPGCIERSRREGDDDEMVWGWEEVRRVRSEWNREGSDDGLDAVYRRELLELVDTVLGVLQ